MPDLLPDLPSPSEGEPPSSRSFTDSAGLGWTVWGISPGQLPPKLRRLLGDEAELTGALLFVSEHNEWRALIPLPARWRRLDESQLNHFRSLAPVVRASD